MFNDAMYYLTIYFQNKMFNVIVSFMTLDEFIKEFHVRFHDLPNIVSIINIDEDEYDVIESLIDNQSQIFEGEDR